MDPIYFVTAVILVLAAIGYLTCLDRHFWVTLAVTALVAGYAIASISIDTQTMPYWGAATLIVLSMVTISWLNGSGQTTPRKMAKARPSKWSTYKGRQIVIDGTNVLYWDDETAQIETLRRVIDYLKQRDIMPIVFLDASSRHHLRDKSLTEKGFARALGLPQIRMMVCPAGTEADVFILKFAKKEGLPILSNDRFGDRSKLAKGIKIVKGVIAGGRPILDGL